MKLTQYNKHCISKAKDMLYINYKYKKKLITPDKEIIRGIKLLHYNLWKFIAENLDYSVRYLKNEYFKNEKYKILNNCYLCTIYDCDNCPLSSKYGICGEFGGVYSSIDSENLLERKDAREKIRDIFKEEQNE